MATYLVANYRVTNPDGYAEYLSTVGPTLEPYGGELLVADFESAIIEGSPFPVTIVVKFPSQQSANDWYRSEEYQEVVHHRTDNTEGFVVFADGIAAS
jgi:uncharacterized protein (DUF1330 family)